MDDQINGLNLRAILPLKFLYDLPFPIFVRERRAASVLNNVFDKLLDQHQVTS